MTVDKNALEKKASITKKKSDSGLSSSSTLNKNVKSTKSKNQTKTIPAVAGRSNVMNTIHNVTVSSPPPSASTSGRSISLTNVRDDEIKKATHVRTRTRTIAPEDSLLYQQKILKLSSDEENSKNLLRNSQSSYESDITPPSVIQKPPVAYEINFEEAKKLKKDVEVTVKPPENEEEEEENYSSDFESYESDFEAESSNTTSSDESNHQVEKNRIDSGSFDMSVKKQSLAQYDSIEDTVNSHDSGISYDDALSRRVLSPKVINFYKRGEELMKKIAFDSITFDLYEQKPIPYEVFMTIYGQRGMNQACTQTDSQAVNEDTQTDKINKSNMWTQHPAKFTKDGLEMTNSKQYNEEKLGVGDEAFDDVNYQYSDDYDLSISAINNFSQPYEMKIMQLNTSETTELNKFVKNAAISISNIIEGKNNSQELQSSKISISRGYLLLKFNEIEVLRDTIVSKIYSNLCLKNFFITIHRKNEDYKNLMCLWNVSSPSHPIRIFSAYSDIKCVEIHPNMRDVIIGGCNDGTICMWNIHEITENLEIVMPCGIVSLSQQQNDFSLDNICAIKSLPHREISTTTSMFQVQSASQICSLHENGTISIWTMLNVESDDFELKKNELHFICNNSKIKLVKNLSIDLTKFTKDENEKNQPRKKSAFDKTRYYFENDLFSDKVLKELQEIDVEKLNRNKSAFRNEFIRALGYDVNYNELFVASDSNYIVALSRLCLGDKARKIITNESNYISPSVIKIHPIDKSIMVVGQSDGSVKFIKTHDEDSVIVAKKRTNFKRSNAATSFEDVLSKSCAFQNIVEKEKKLYDETQALNNLESDELKAFIVNQELSNQLLNKSDELKLKLKIKFDKNIFNSFDVCTGSVKAIEFNKTGEFIFILINKQLRIFDCWKNIEIDHQDERKFTDVKCIQSDGSDFLVRKKLVISSQFN